MTRLSDLPPEVRARIARGEARLKGAAGPHHSHVPAAPRPTTPQFRCHRCGELFTSWAAAERHARATLHHGRVECLFEQAVVSQRP